MTLTPKITVNQLAAAWGCSAQSIRNKVYAGTIPYIKIGSRIYFEESELAAWEETRRHRPAKPAPPPPDHKKTRTREEECAWLGIPVNHRYS